MFSIFSPPRRLSLFCCLVLPLAFIPSAQAAPVAEEVTPESVSHLLRPENVSLSADGQHFVLDVAGFSKAGAPPVSRIVMGDVQAPGRVVPLRCAADGDHDPAWSPDGGVLAFVGKHGAAVAGLWICRPGETRARRVATPPGGVVAFRWAPDGHALLAIVTDAAKPPPSGASVTGAASGGAVFIVSLDGTAPRPVKVGQGVVFDADWSPDGRRLVVRSGDDAGLDALWYRSRLSIVDLDGRVVATLPVHATAVHPSFSPDGRHLAYGAFDEDGITGAAGRYDLDDGSLHPLGGRWDGSIRAMHWDADGMSLTGLGLDGPSPRMIRISAADGAVTPGAPLGGEPYGFSAAADGTVAVIASAPDDPDNVWLVQGERKTRLTDFNPQVRRWSLGAQKIVHWRSSRDGTVLDGILVLPPGRQTDLPLVVQIHGGPYDAWADGWLASWHDWARLLAAHGIATLMPNPRGSDGRGRAFADATRHGWGDLDGQDVLDGVDALEQAHVADPKRLAIAGWSYGGFMSAWLAGHGDRFRTAIDGAGPVELAGMALTTDVATGFLPPYFGDPVRDRAAYEARSPLSFVDAIHIPVLLLHGAADARVPPDQSLMFYNALKTRGATVTRVTYAGAPHWFGGSVSAATEIDVQQRVLSWLQHSLLH
ncbi:acyl-peptide hydrolase [Gluconacetobacter liquefaciens]|uniref:Dipeptidyl aminopeptidase/acylaminoacyl peptidase n=1 Tax=Gluconacetobacter liquefaciens TaxID=89584 RepID=A0A370G2R2_GLULI|nr:S9 family peptidase [Gluconacetobacter liquefaciens]MBB2187380.1 S9 family peptidase [Gluconacetobacter liquefaciens]RDI36343.1 dipeptidyl aminopeptidase/acylaminoacyl peptidase [Gluconacetobacter liquefaciens]GBQ96012.1 peptidase S9 prolyl oligopeptidase active site domain-containing protein [Gluconacetobacter liquefaciens NRIC 0522]GEB37897.1 acyl-peptide hydrolase [Gluconacetobacter liquefaciens]